MTAQDGASTLACGEHLWAVTTASDRRRGKPPRILETQEMAGSLRSAHRHRYELQLVSAPVDYPERDVPMDPYALGLLLGDGCLTTSTTPSFSTADSGAGAVARACARWDRARAQGRIRLHASKRSWRPRRPPDRESRHRGAPHPRARGHPVEHEVHPGGLSLQHTRGPDRAAAGPARHRRRPGHAVQAHVPDPVHDHVAAASRRRRASRALPWRASRTCVHARRQGARPDGRMAVPSATGPMRTCWTSACRRRSRRSA